MAVVTRPLKGVDRLWIDLVLTKEDGSARRYRRVAKVQNEKAARAEELALLQHWGRHFTFPGEGEPKAAVPTAVITKGKGGASWEDAVKYFTEHSLPARKETTRRGYEAMLDGPWFTFWEGKPLSEITYRSVQSWDLKMREGAVAPSTRRNHHILLRSIIKSVGPLEDEPGVLLDTVPKFPSLPKVGQGEVVATSPQEVELLLSRVTHRGLLVAIALSAFGGLRAGEIRALTKGDITLETDRLWVSKSLGIKKVDTPKGLHARAIPLNPLVKSILEPILRTLKDQDLVSTNEDGGVWTIDGLSLAYRRWAQRLGLKSKRFHSLRHHFATECSSQLNLPAPNIQALLGHKDLKTTQRYVHANYETSKNAVQKLGLDIGRK